MCGDVQSEDTSHGYSSCPNSRQTKPDIFVEGCAEWRHWPWLQQLSEQQANLTWHLCGGMCRVKTLAMVKAAVRASVKPHLTSMWRDVQSEDTGHCHSSCEGSWQVSPDIYRYVRAGMWRVKTLAIFTAAVKACCQTSPDIYVRETLAMVTAAGKSSWQEQLARAVGKPHLTPMWRDVQSEDTAHGYSCCEGSCQALPDIYVEGCAEWRHWPWLQLLWGQLSSLTWHLCGGMCRVKTLAIVTAAVRAAVICILPDIYVEGCVEWRH